MKKVRFRSPAKILFDKMNISECHSPRPFLESQFETKIPSEGIEFSQIKTYVSDPVERFESSNSIPYPIVNITNSQRSEVPDWSPSHDLELSMLDASCYEPRQSINKPLLNSIDSEIPCKQVTNERMKPLTSIENRTHLPLNVLSKDGGFFIRRDNLDTLNLNTNNHASQMNRLSLDKENNPKAMKAEYFKSLQSQTTESLYPAHVKEALFTTVKQSPTSVKQTLPSAEQILNVSPQSTQNESVCKCYNCLKISQSNSLQSHDSVQCQRLQCIEPPVPKPCNHNSVKVQRNCYVCVCMEQIPKPVCKTCHFVVTGKENEVKLKEPNAVDKKTWAIQRYEETNNPDATEIVRQSNIKEKREPTVADLFKIIKLQNEQLQLLQDKVDRFITSSNETKKLQASTSIQNIGSESNPSISIGVMTSFEMIRTSTVINKEIVTQTTENAQIQCNRSQISIKEVVSKAPVMNFLDGIVRNEASSDHRKKLVNSNSGENGGTNDEKTLNELSLYNVQIDNATTPLMSPEHSLCLDVRDYSDSESSDDQTHNGWTYYNKVMNHVNGMLQDSDMPSSASALYRNTRQQCLQMQIDKTNVSITKRVTFGDDKFRPQPIPVPIMTTDTSLKMNQLAAKYLQNGLPQALTQQYMLPPVSQPADVSLATRNYIDRHRISREGASPAMYTPHQATTPVPRCLDVTSLKQQPKLL